MRPEILNPLFAEVDRAEGRRPGAGQAAGAAGDRARGRPGCSTCRPAGSTGRARRVDGERCGPHRRDHADAARATGSARGRGTDAGAGDRQRGNTSASPISAADSGWVTKLLPLGEPRRVSGRLDLYGQELQIVHPDQSPTPRTGVPRARADLSAVGRAHLAPDRAAGGAGARRVPGAGRMDRAQSDGAARLAELARRAGAIHADPADANARDATRL